MRKSKDIIKDFVESITRKSFEEIKDKLQELTKDTYADAIMDIRNELSSGKYKSASSVYSFIQAKMDQLNSINKKIHEKIVGYKPFTPDLIFFSGDELLDLMNLFDSLSRVVILYKGGKSEHETLCSRKASQYSTRYIKNMSEGGVWK